nr:hypothetical protein [Brucella anthropi]
MNTLAVNTALASGASVQRFGHITLPAREVDVYNQLDQGIDIVTAAWESLANMANYDDLSIHRVLAVLEAGIQKLEPIRDSLLSDGNADAN